MELEVVWDGELKEEEARRGCLASLLVEGRSEWERRYTTVPTQVGIPLEAIVRACKQLRILR